MNLLEIKQIIHRLRGQLTNCVRHLNHINRRFPREDMTEVIEQANKALYETESLKFEEESYKGLKPCPFCGSEMDMDDLDTLHPSGVWWRPHEEQIKIYISNANRLETDHACYLIRCYCGCEMHEDGYEEVINRWNSRS